MSEERIEQDIDRVFGKVEAEDKTTEGLGFITGRQSLETSLKEIPELVNNWVRAGDLSLLVGFGGVGKSTIALNLSLSAAGGIGFIGYDVDSAVSVAYLDLEMGEYEFRSRLNMLLPQYPEITGDNFYYKCMSNFTLKDKRNQARLENELALIQPKLLVIDNHASFHGGDPNRESEMMVNVILPFREMMAKFDLAILYLMHTPWLDRDRPRGTAAIFDAASTVVAITTHENNRHLKWTKRRSVRRHMGADEIDIRYDIETYQVHLGADLDIQEILASVTFPIKRKGLAEMLMENLSHASAYRRIRELIENKLLKDVGEGMIDRTPQERMVGIIKGYKAGLLGSESDKAREMREAGLS